MCHLRAYQYSATGQCCRLSEIKYSLAKLTLFHYHPGIYIRRAFSMFSVNLLYLAHLTPISLLITNIGPMSRVLEVS